MKCIKAFILGLMEFRQAFTTSYFCTNTQYIYDLGRDMAHKLTFRRYED